MFEWLDQELKLINTKKFHLVTMPVDEQNPRTTECYNLPFPASYKEFVSRFGSVMLYRKHSYYKIGVYASPRREMNRKSGEVFYRFGHCDSNGAFFKETLLREGEESPVFEGGEDRMHIASDCFQSWFNSACESARRTYTEKEWQAIRRGPSPFSPHELRIVEARRKFQWRIVGTGGDGKVLFEVYNGSDIVLPFLSVGIRGKQRDCEGLLEGCAWLPIGALLPGQTVVIEKECYKNAVEPKSIEAFERPDPEPEDRDRFWEFKSTSN